METIVTKFGGTSMGTAESILKVTNILQQYQQQTVVVVSAVSGITDQLLKLGEAAIINKNWTPSFNEIIKKHDIIIQQLCCNTNLQTYYKEIHEIVTGIQLIKELSPSTKDKLLSYGERMSSEILNSQLNLINCSAQQVDAYSLIKTDNSYGEGIVNTIESQKRTEKTLLPILNNKTLPVITGFIAQSENKHYITLGRGGSDYTAALIASYIQSKELHIWTDVDGIYNADPRKITSAQVIPEISYHEASELAYFGAKVLHPKTIKPAIERNIPVRIKNTFNPNQTGTLINHLETESLKSVTYKKGISIINICSTGMLNAHGFLSKIFDVFTQQKVVIDVVSTSEVSVSVTVDNGDYKKVIKELEKFSTVNVFNKMAIICLVGNGMKNDTKTLSRLFSAIPSVNISMISQGASQRNITFLVKEDMAESVTKNIYNEFFNK